MVNDELRADLDAAERAFETTPDVIEDGLDVDDPELVQLRRACRLLAAGSLLLDRGYYTVVIESAFVAIERTIQFRLIHDGAMGPEQVISNHNRLYQRGPRPAYSTTPSASDSLTSGTRTGRKPTTGSGSQRKNRPRRCTNSPPVSTTTWFRRAGLNTNVSAGRDRDVGRSCPRWQVGPDIQFFVIDRRQRGS